MSASTNGLDLKRREAAMHNAFGQMICNILSNVSLSRQEWVRSRTGDARRDIEDECGHSKGEWSAEQYQKMYDYNPIAGRVVEVFSRESWQITPEVYEDEDPTKLTSFEKAWLEVSQKLRGMQSRFKKQQGNPIWECLRRADRLSGIGRYGVILLGLDDGLPLDRPAAGINELNSMPLGTGDVLLSANRMYGITTNASPTPRRNLLYLSVFPEALADITKVEGNRSSPRFRLPTEYQITLTDPKSGLPGTASGNGTVKVHWTRVVHLADNIESSEVYGVPRQKPVRYRLEDLQKLYGGSAEMYWRGAFPGLSFQTHPALGGDVEMDQESIKDEAEQYMTGLQRYLATVGIDVKSLAPQVVDPTPQIERQIEAICIRLGIPKRIFMGSERGELASSQDDAAWNDRLRDRQDNYITPRIIIPFVDRLIHVGVLPDVEEFSVYWPDLTSQSAEEKAKVAVSQTQALVQYIQGNVQQVMAIRDFLFNVMGFTEAEASQFFENAKNTPAGEKIESVEQASLKMEAASLKAGEGNTVRSQGRETK